MAKVGGTERQKHKNDCICFTTKMTTSKIQVSINSTFLMIYGSLTYLIFNIDYKEDTLTNSTRALKTKGFYCYNSNDNNLPIGLIKMSQSE